MGFDLLCLFVGSFFLVACGLLGFFKDLERFLKWCFKKKKRAFLFIPVSASCPPARSCAIKTSRNKRWIEQYHVLIYIMSVFRFVSWNWRWLAEYYTCWESTSLNLCFTVFLLTLPKVLQNKLPQFGSVPPVSAISPL